MIYVVKTLKVHAYERVVSAEIHFEGFRRGAFLEISTEDDNAVGVRPEPALPQVLHDYIAHKAHDIYRTREELGMEPWEIPRKITETLAMYFSPCTEIKITEEEAS